MAHNIARVETHVIDGRRRQVCVHRKGATRAFGPGHDEIPLDYREVGQPVLVPGSMGTASYVLAGTAGAMRETFGSTCHGAGRTMSRTRARKQVRGDELKFFSAITLTPALPRTALALPALRHRT